MEQYINYPIIFWLFLFGSVLGVVLEGVFCLFFYKKWETHTVAVWGPFCIIYGLGAVGLYIGAILFENINKFGQFLLFALIATSIEYFCGKLLKDRLGMRAWDYSRHRFNLEGLICPHMTLAWGLMGIFFADEFVPLLKRAALIVYTAPGNYLCGLLSVFMLINFVLTAVCIMRWSQRHRGIPASNRFLEYIDRKYDDEKMSGRFCEWSFINEI